MSSIVEQVIAGLIAIGTTVAVKFAESYIKSKRDAATAAPPAAQQAEIAPDHGVDPP